MDGTFKLNFPVQSTFAMFLLQEMENEDSFYKYFVDIGPSLETLPLLYTELEKEFLNGTTFLEELEIKLDHIEKDYKSIAKEIPEVKTKYSFDKFINAFALAEFSDLTVL